jgi:hypothetical protein
MDGWGFYIPFDKAAKTLEFDPAASFPDMLFPKSFQKPGFEKV